MAKEEEEEGKNTAKKTRNEKGERQRSDRHKRKKEKGDVRGETE
jgi:hypothetical protein